MTRIFCLLQSPRPYNCEELASMLNTSTRTVYRYLDILRQAEVDVIYDKRKGGYIIRPLCDGSKMPRLTADELSLLLLAAHNSPLQEIPGLHEIIESAAGKIMASTDAHLRSRLEELISGYKSEIQATVDNQDVNGIMPSIIAAVREKKCVRLTLEDATCTKLSIYGIDLTGDNFTLTGRSSVDRSVVTIDVKSVKGIELLHEEAEVPPHFRGRWRGDRRHPPTDGHKTTPSKSDKKRPEEK